MVGTLLIDGARRMNIPGRSPMGSSPMGFEFFTFVCLDFLRYGFKYCCMMTPIFLTRSFAPFEMVDSIQNQF